MKTGIEIEEEEKAYLGFRDNEFYWKIKFSK